MRGVYVGATMDRGSSVGGWLVGALLVGGGILWARHQSRQVERLYASSGLPYQSFAGSLRDSAGGALRGIAARVRPNAGKED
jgi:hypothetical protein